MRCDLQRNQTLFQAFLGCEMPNSRYNVATASTTRLRLCDHASATNAITGGTNAPPDTPIIISAEIEPSLSGLCCRANEKIIENTFANITPLRAIRTHNSHGAEQNISAATAKMATAIVTLSIFSGLSMVSTMAPTNVPAVRATKYRLVPKAA